MIAKFARLEFELFTRPSKSDFLRVYHPSGSKQKKQFYPGISSASGRKAASQLFGL